MLRISLIISVFAAGCCLFSCKNEPKPVAEQTAPKVDTVRVTPVPTEGAVTYVVSEGAVAWAAQKAIGGGHEGEINIESGEFQVNQGRVLSGKIVLDMSSTHVTDLEDAGQRNELETHLKSADFFNVKQFGKGTFVIDEVLPSNNPDFNQVISGQLTLKGKSNTVNIPVKITINGNELSAISPPFEINRTNWGINFRSGALGTTKDKLIKDGVMLAFKIKAKAK